jgi:copper(I)-binding protein
VNRALRAATMGALLLSPVVLSACGAGQVTQTATQDRDKTGGQAKVAGITLREVTIAYPRGGAYDPGDSAPLRMAIVNSTAQSDTLTGIEGKGFASAQLSGARPENTAAGTTAPDSIEIPAGETVFVGRGSVRAELMNLTDTLTTGEQIPIVLTFENAGEVTVPALVANPDGRTHDEGFDFKQSNGEESGGQNGPG